MDVSFTNILQDARQYFQGLPTATCSTTNSSYPNPEERQNNHYGMEQNQEKTPSAGPYWPHQETQLRSQSREHPTVDPSQRPLSHQPEAQQPIHNQPVNPHQDTLRSPTSYHHPDHSVQASHSYQFSRPHSREVQQHQQQHVPQQHQQQHVAQQHTQQPQRANPQTQLGSQPHQPQAQHSTQLQQQTQHPQQHQQQSQHSQQLQRNSQQQQHISQQQSQYQSHILPNPSYYQVPTSQQTQSRTPARTTDQQVPPSSQSYHQVQQPQNHSQQHPSQSYPNYQQQQQQQQQQQRSYYTNHLQPQSQSQTYHQSYQVASSQAYSQPQEPSYIHQAYPTHSQHSYQSNGNYATPKTSTSVTQETNSIKESPTTNHGSSNQNQQTSQPYRTTHNLPPIAALSSLNYHSSRSSREVSRITANKPRMPSSAIPTSSSYNAKPAADGSVASQQNARTSVQYPTTSGHNEYPQTSRPSINQSYHYVPPTSTQSNSQYAPTLGTPSTTVASQNQPSSNHANFPSYPQQDASKTYQSTNSKTIVQDQQPTVNQSNQSNVGAVLNMKQKRESPLDLSVKTVRTSADSTFTDPDPNANDVQRLGKYYQVGRPPRQAPMQAPAAAYSSYDMYANSSQRNYPSKPTQVPSAAGVPKVDFFPNFNIPAMHQATNKNDNRRLVTNVPYDSVNQRQQYDKKNAYHQTPSNSLSRTATNAVPTSAHLNSTPTVQPPLKKSIQGLPRIDFLPPAHKASTMYAVPSNDIQKKRTSDPISSMVPSKVPKVDSWRQTIDQQIEQRLSSYAKSRLQQDQAQKQAVPSKQLVNGSYTPLNQERPKENYPTTYHRPQYNPNTQYPNINHYNNIPPTHNQSYIPTHQYPGYPNHGSQQQQQQQQQQASYTQHSLTRANSNPSLPITGVNRNNIGGAADRRVLSLLRNSLEIKGAKEAQKKLEQEQHRPREQLQHHHRSDVQQPSTDVMAPLQPKPGVVGRHNMSPFAATSLSERSSNTPPTYKFHIPKAIDSIKFDAEVAKDNRMSEKMNKQMDGSNATITNANTDLDGFAALLAARIRTKAELKQVGLSQYTANNNATNTNLVRSVSETQLSRSGSKDHNAEGFPTSTGGSPPKLTREKVAHLPRRRLFSRTEEDSNGMPTSNVPLRDKSGLRSSSETSVFDFPDSDSDTEMPVLERQSLVEMRRDRKTYPKPAVDEDVAITPMSSLDLSFDDACDKFMMQLKGGVGKKRGRRKKVIEADVLAKLETVVTKERPVPIEVKTEKFEQVLSVDEIKIEKVENKAVEAIKAESDSDSDVPLIKCKSKLDAAEQPGDNAREKVDKKTVKRELSSDSSDSDSETIIKLSEKLKVKKTKNSGSKKGANKINKEDAIFGDGADFRPGWEEEVYNYKRSLRMPPSLIHVTRPPHWHRLSTSLPDLDPCPNSPSPSENAECTKMKIKNEPDDSDMDSNSNFSFVFNKTNYDSEEGSSSVKSLPFKSKTSTSILDRLIERYGAPKRKKTNKKKEELPSKIVQKTNDELELLATPTLNIPNLPPAKKAKDDKKTIKYGSELIGFRKKTGDKLKNNLLNNSNSNATDQFQTVVLKSRTRMELRALKQKATIKEVFGEDRPASAPPVTCVDNTESRDNEDVENKDKNQLNLTFTKDGDSTENEIKVNIELENTKEALKYKILNRGKKSNDLFKTIANKKISSEFADDDIIIKRELDRKSETPSLDGDEYAFPTRKRMKNIRRKFSSGFDYIRKKKKQVKKEGAELEASKPRRKTLFLKTSPESVQDIQKEIKMWVMNKGIGETHLHRAARLGYTDITAYCLEKLDGTASPKDNAGYTPLHEACARGHLNIAKLLLLYGANVSESAQGGIRPLHEAAENGYVEMVRLLLSYGADPTLATYSGYTPLSLATDDATVNLLKHHIAEMQGEVSSVWSFMGPSCCFDLDDSGYDPLEDVPKEDEPSEDEDMEFELSDSALPNLYTIRGESQNERWILLQDLSNILKIKSRDALMRQICPVLPSTSATSGYKNVLRELKMTDFLEQASCCQYMCAGEKINTRASKIALVKYSDKVRQLLGVDKIIIAAR